MITVVEHLSMYDAAMGDISNVIAARKLSESLKRSALGILSQILQSRSYMYDMHTEQN